MSSWIKKPGVEVKGPRLWFPRELRSNLAFLCFKNVWLRTDIYVVAVAKLLQSCLTLCDPIDGSPPGSPVPGILQARTLEWVAISFPNAWKWTVKVKSFSRVPLFTTPWTAAHQAPLSMGFSRQEYWSGLWFPSPDTSVRVSKTERLKQVKIAMFQSLSLEITVSILQYYYEEKVRCAWDTPNIERAWHAVSIQLM